MSVRDDIHAIIENVMESRFSEDPGTGAYGRTLDPTLTIAQNGELWSASFRIDGRTINLGKLLNLSRRLGTEDVEVEVLIDTSYTRPDGYEPSDPGPDDHVRYTIKGIRL